MKRQLIAFAAGVACLLLGFLFCLPASAATHLAFDSLREGNYDIYIMDTTDPSEEPLNLTDHPAHDWGPAFSPDGQWMAFASNRDGANRIYLLNRNRNELRPLTTHLESEADFDPDWSPDGRWIVFTCDLGRPKHNQICKINVNTGELEQLTDTGEDHRFPKWSPDGDRIVFYSDREEGRDRFLMKPNGNGVRRVIERPHGGGQPTWSPDGKQIAYSMLDLGGDRIYVMTDEGQNNRRITHPYSGRPAWSPDGQWIAYEFEVDAWVHPRDSNIHLVSPDGILTRQLTEDPGSDQSPAWVPEAFLSVSPTVEKQTTLWGRLKQSVGD